jgi:hypothetical protein
VHTHMTLTIVMMAHALRVVTLDAETADITELLGLMLDAVILITLWDSRRFIKLILKLRCSKLISSLSASSP